MTYLASVGISILLFAMLGLSLNFLLGYTGQMTMAHAAFYGFGAYAATLLVLPTVSAAATPQGSFGCGLVTGSCASGAGLPLSAAMIGAVALSFALAWVISIPAARRVHGEYLICSLWRSK